jgi:hypothetical protein
MSAAVATTPTPTTNHVLLRIPVPTLTLDPVFIGTLIDEGDVPRNLVPKRERRRQCTPTYAD